jgi:hypothetical protein
LTQIPKASGLTQVEHPPAHTASQQTPSTQNPLAQSPAVVHRSPSASERGVPPAPPAPRPPIPAPPPSTGSVPVPVPSGESVRFEQPNANSRANTDNPAKARPHDIVVDDSRLPIQCDNRRSMPSTSTRRMLLVLLSAATLAAGCRLKRRATESKDASAPAARAAFSIDATGKLAALDLRRLEAACKRMKMKAADSEASLETGMLEMNLQCEGDLDDVEVQLFDLGQGADDDEDRFVVSRVGKTRAVRLVVPMSGRKGAEGMLDRALGGASVDDTPPERLEAAFKKQGKLRTSHSQELADGVRLFQGYFERRGGDSFDVDIFDYSDNAHRSGKLGRKPNAIVVHDGTRLLIAECEERKLAQRFVEQVLR